VASSPHGSSFRDPEPQIAPCHLEPRGVHRIETESGGRRRIGRVTPGHDGVMLLFQGCDETVPFWLAGVLVTRTWIDASIRNGRSVVQMSRLITAAKTVTGPASQILVRA
jgi:hypothetical protein